MRSIPLVYFETLCLKEYRVLVSKDTSGIVSHVYSSQLIIIVEQESSAEQVSLRSSFVCAGAAAYLGGQQDEMIPMPGSIKMTLFDQIEPFE